MRSTPMLRIAWKDYRRLRGFWIVLVVFFALSLLYVAWSMIVNSRSGGLAYSDSLTYVLFTTTFYCLGCGAITFAAEHEERTHAYLQTLPLQGSSIFYGKLFYLTISAIAMIAVLAIASLLQFLWLRQYGVSTEWGFASDHYRQLGVHFSSALTSLPLSAAIGMFWSLRTKRPESALILSAGSMIFVIFALLVTMSEISLNDHGAVDLTWQNIRMGLICGCIGLPLLLLDRKLVDGWIQTHGSRRFRSPSPAMLPSASISATRASAWGSIGRLFWLQSRQSLRMCLTLGLLGVLAAFFSGAGGGLGFTAVVLVFLGLLTFRYEHEGKRFRFLQTLGVGPGEYWVSRHLIPGSISFLIVLIVVIGTSSVVNWNHGRLSIGALTQVTGLQVLLGGLALFSISQFCSIAFPNYIISIACTLMGTICLFVWMQLCDWLSLPLSVSIVPIIFALLLSSYLRVPRWFRDTGSWRQWLIPLVPVMLMLVFLPCWFALYRVYEVPQVALPFYADDRLTSLEDTVPVASNGDLLTTLATISEGSPDARVFQSNHYRLPHELGSDWVNDNTSRIPVLMDASQQQSSVFVGPGDLADAQLQCAVALLVTDAGKLENDGEIAAAWERYQAALRLARLHNDGRHGIAGAVAAYGVERAIYRHFVPWAMHEKNTYQRIDDAARWLEDFRRSQPAWTQVLKGEYQQLVDVLEGRLNQGPTSDREIDLRTMVRLLAPWEVARARRLADCEFVNAYAMLTQLERDVNGSTHQTVKLIGPGVSDSSLFPIHFLDVVDAFSESSIRAEYERRGTIYQLAAIAHHWQHGAYPSSFVSISMDDSSLPNDIFANTKMSLQKVYIPKQVEQEPTDSEEPPELAIYYLIEPTRRHDTYLSHSRLRSLPTTPFWVPTFSVWNDIDYEQCLEISQSNPPMYSSVTEYQESYNNSQNPVMQGMTHAEGQPSMDTGGVYGMGGYTLPRDVEGSKSQLSRDLIDRIQISDPLNIAIRSAGKTMLVDGPVQQRLMLIETLGNYPNESKGFLPQLKQCAMDENQLISRAATQAISRIDPHLVLNTSNVWMAHHRAMGDPVENPSNGHFYRVFAADALSWKQAYCAALKHSHQGVSGHLVTITSEQENNFLIAQFGHVGVCWAGASDEQEEGVWQWVTGPERGTEFWRRGTARERGYEAWNVVTGEPNSRNDGEDYLAWNWDLRWTDQQAGRWIDLDDEDSRDHGVRAYIVEYSQAVVEGDEEKRESDNEGTDPANQ